jgi:proteic killer suppression protein
MRIQYSSKKLEKILTDIRLMKKYYGSDHIKISNRLSELRAVNNLNEIPEIPPPRRHKLSGKYDGCWGIDYSKNDRIIIQPIGKFDINDLTSIVEVLVISLEDYH